MGDLERLTASCEEMGVNTAGLMGMSSSREDPVHRRSKRRQQRGETGLC